MGNFVRDLRESQVAVDALLEDFRAKGFDVEELLGKEAQKFGDFEYGKGDGPKTKVEVKFDRMSAKTGNMCFELGNNKGPSGISITKADVVVYVCPKDSVYTAYTFPLEALKTHIADYAAANKKSNKKGGDKRRFHLVVVPIADIESLGWSTNTFEVQK